MLSYSYTGIVTFVKMFQTEMCFNAKKYLFPYNEKTIIPACKKIRIGIELIIEKCYLMQIVQVRDN